LPVYSQQGDENLSRLNGLRIINGARKYSWISRLNGSDDIRAVANTRLSITCHVVSKIEGAV
jgi:hypothetical protein